MSIDVSAIKDAQRKMWTIGDYPGGCDDRD
jgi:hypothetical protein